MIDLNFQDSDLTNLVRLAVAIRDGETELADRISADVIDRPEASVAAAVAFMASMVLGDPDETDQAIALHELAATVLRSRRLALEAFRQNGDPDGID